MSWRTQDERGPPKAIIARSFFAAEIGRTPFQLSRKILACWIRLWTSSKKLRPEGLQLANGSVLPPETLASLGTKKTVDPKQLHEFTQIKKEAERICLEAATRFIGGFANPADEIPRIVNEFDALSRQFYEERERLRVHHR